MSLQSIQIKYSKFIAQAATVLALMIANSAWSQEQDQQGEPEYTAPLTPQSRLLFFEVPTAFEPELDAVLPVLPTLDPEQDPAFLERMESIRLYNESVESIELDGGAWDRQLAQELSALGILQQQQGNHLEAVAAFNRAIHVNRINSGLHTLEQIPEVERLIDSHLAIGEWEKADLYFNYLFYIQQKAFGPNDPRIIPVLDRLANWNIQAFSIGFGESLGLRLSSAQILFNAAARMVAAHFGEDDERVKRYRHNIANSAYLVSRNPELMAESERVEYRTAQDMLREKLNEQGPVRPRGFQAGETALREIVQYYAKQDNVPYELAESLANLADWYLIFGRRRVAEGLYNQAWNILSDYEEGEEWIARLFGQVVPIPTFANSVEYLLTKPITTTDGKTLNYDYIDVLLDVTENGVARKVEILSEESEANSSQFTRLRREIRNSHFRPHVVNGETMRSDHNYFRYRYWY